VLLAAVIIASTMAEAVVLVEWAVSLEEGVRMALED
jgi:hypothetical protein